MFDLETPKIVGDSVTNIGQDDLPLEGTENAQAVDRDGTLEKRFNIFSTIGVQFALQATPLLIGTYLVVGIYAGGSPFFIYSFIIAVTFNAITAISLAEVAGFLPHPAGQVYWAAKLAPPGWDRSLSYVTGALTQTAWVFILAGSFLFAAELLLAIVAVCKPTFTITAYWTFICYVGFCGVSFIYNTYGFSLFPASAKFMLYYISIATVVMLALLLARTHPKASSQQVFVEIDNQTGWSNGVTFFLALLPGVTASTGFDSSAHLAEEIPEPARNIPRIMTISTLLIGYSAVPPIIAILFCLKNIDALQDPIGGQPFYQLLVDGLDSHGLTIFVTVMILAVFPFANACVTVSTIRCWWTFAEAGAFYQSEWQARIHRSWKVPYNAAIVVTCICVLLGVLIFGPDSVLSNLLSCANISFLLSYCIPILLFLVKGRDKVPHKRHFHLGRAGPVLNILSIIWTLLISVFFCFPSDIPVTALVDMNWLVVVLFGMGFLWILNWLLVARKQYTVPPDKLIVINGVTNAITKRAESEQEQK